jgi:hypothetical protein
MKALSIHSPMVIVYLSSLLFFQGPSTEAVPLSCQFTPRDPEGITTVHLEDHQNSALQLQVVGTGATTGHIATLTVKNLGNEDIELLIGPLYIPSEGIYQSYIIDKTTRFVVSKNASETIRLYGYCTDAFKDPVPHDVGLPHPSRWVRPNSAYFDNKGFSPESYTEEFPGFGFSELSKIQPTEISTHFLMLANHLDRDLQAEIFSDSESGLPHHIDTSGIISEKLKILLLDEVGDSKHKSFLYWDAVNKIKVAVDASSRRGKLQTPYSSNPERERDAVVQQTLWKYTALSIGRSYTYNHFLEKLAEQFKSTSGFDIRDAPSEIKVQFDEGAEAFWKTFQSVVREAKLIREISIEN